MLFADVVRKKKGLYLFKKDLMNKTLFWLYKLEKVESGLVGWSD
jgi:hypothetical protein